MKKKRTDDVLRMAEAIEDNFTFVGNPELHEISHKKVSSVPGESSAEILRKKIVSADDIMKISKVEIPKCETTPVNGRIFVVEVDGSETVTPSGIILPHKLAVKKSDEVRSICRYFVVAWAEDIPDDVKELLYKGIEVNPFLPQEAEEWNLPKVIDFNTGGIFKVIHYTELAGVSDIKPVNANE